MLRTGFDGVEILGANSYLINQFLEDTGNKRINVYGCSIEIRARFALKVLDAVVEHIGQNGTELRLTPWGIVGHLRRFLAFCFVFEGVCRTDANCLRCYSDVSWETCR